MSTIELPTQATVKQIFEYTARRAGGRITIYGKDVNGANVVITRIDAIQAATPWPIASRDDGSEFQLVTTGAAHILPEG